MRAFLQSVFVVLLRLLAWTWRIRLTNTTKEMLKEILFIEQPIILFWHDEMLPLWRYFAPRHTQHYATALTSMSKDGDVLAELLSAWGYAVVRGSSSRGGNEALHDIVEATQNGAVLLTPDGPRGPRHKCKVGGIVAAHRTGKPLRLVRISTKGWRLMRSWDQFLIPYPFATIDIVISESLLISPTATREQISDYVQDVETRFSALLENISAQ